MSQSKRVFQFEGNDNDYIAFLESRLSAALSQSTSQSFIESATSLCNAPTTTSSDSQPSNYTTTSADSQHETLAIASVSSMNAQPSDYRNGCSVSRASCPTSPRPTRSSPLPTGEDLKILYYDPIQNRDSDLLSNNIFKFSSLKQTSVVEAQGKKELRHFIEEVTRKDHWIKRKKELGLSRPEINQDTINALCGRPLASNLRNESNLYPNKDSSEHSALIMRGCDYGALTKGRKLQGNLLLHIAKYQQLVFVSLCVVMLEIGTPIDSVDWMMRRYISDTSSANLRRLRYGCKWVNRCMSKLLEQNWGFSSWEAFILCWYSHPQELLHADNLKFRGLSNNTADLHIRKTVTKHS
ncbi:unnamed protein product [Penicillium olsonii]|uniref:Uncharacterized protein n=1 Tax=Penicillium olsonii TaxID=99116 RepID=A0A9W4MZJ1_PENOL|nr:unnamed protein product [Penicillium olsonii]